MENIYAQDKTQGSAEAHIAGSFRSRLYAKHNLRIIKRCIKKGSILEIGAGAGYFLDEARKEGFEVCGIELNGNQADFIRNKLRIPCEESSLNTSSFAGKRFDIVYHCDVLSHFYDPIAEFTKMKDVLRNDGIIAFETGNFGDIEERYLKAITTFQYPDHLFFFSENSLRELLRLTGFQLIAMHRYSIQAGLWFYKIKKKLTSLGGYQQKVRNIGGGTAQVRTTNRDTWLTGLMKDVLIYFFFLTRYYAGGIMPKKGRPQTVLVIARKI
jgi:SAM-dependent methyltransferase